MRILGIEPGPWFSVMDVHRGWMRAFQKAGHDVASLNLGERIDFYASAHVKRGRRYIKAVDDVTAVKLVAKGIHASVFEFQPDVVFLTSCFFVPTDTLDLMRARGIKVVLFHTESPYEDDRQSALSVHADVNLVNDPTNIHLFDNAIYQWHCYDPAVHHRRVPRDECRSDFTFVGTAFPSRIAFFEQVDWDGIDVALAGNWSRLAAGSPLRKFLAHDIGECCNNTDAVDLYCAAKTSANLYRVEAERAALSSGWALGPREVELAACGVPFLRQSRGEGDGLFPMLPTFDTPTSFEHALRGLLAVDHDARAGLGAAIADSVRNRTFDESAQRLLALL